MPRGKRRTTPTGEDAQNIGSVPGQRYGEGVEQQQLQRAMPAPDVTGNIPTGSGAPAPAPMPTPTAAAGPDEMISYLQGNNPNLLQGTNRPQEPITAGLSTGAGPGREALMVGQGSTPIGRYLSRIATETGNTKWARMRERAGL